MASTNRGERGVGLNTGVVTCKYFQHRGSRTGIDDEASYDVTKLNKQRTTADIESVRPRSRHCRKAASVCMTLQHQPVTTGRTSVPPWIARHATSNRRKRRAPGGASSFVSLPVFVYTRLLIFNTRTVLGRDRVGAAASRTRCCGHSVTSQSAASEQPCQVDLIRRRRRMTTRTPYRKRKRRK